MKLGDKIKLSLFLIFATVLTISIFQTPQFKIFSQEVVHLGYVGAFVIGIFFVSTFTVGLATVLLLSIGHTLPPIMIALVAGLGATVGNTIIFLGTKKVAGFFSKKTARTKKHHIVHHHWTLPALGMLIMMSPLPDEIGVALVSFFKMKTHHFLLLSYALKTTGIFLLLSAPYIIQKIL